MSVTSGLCTLRPVWGMILLNVFIIGLDSGAKSTLSKFKEDTKLGGVVGTPQESQVQQRGV